MPKFQDIQHSDYARMWRRWRMAQCFARGGVHVLKPDFDVQRVAYATVIKTDSQAAEGQAAELPLSPSSYRWRTTPARSFLWKHARETLSEYNQRQDRAIHFPLFQSLINIYSGGILRKPPRLAADTIAPEWDIYLADIDRRGTGIEAFRRQLLAGGLTFGRFHVVTDRPWTATPAASRGEQLARGERAYSYFVSPLALEDWELDEAGSFKWVRMTEPYYQKRDPDQKPPSSQFVQYRVWARDFWKLYTPVFKGSGDSQSVQDYVEAAAGDNPLGRVPIRTLNLSKEDSGENMACESPLANSLDSDRYNFNQLSELDELERSQTWAILHIPGFRGGLMDIGPFRALGGGETSVAPSFVSPPSDLPNSKLNRIMSRLWASRQYDGAGRGNAEYSREERSGEALNIETEDKRNQMSLWGAAMQETENGVYLDVAEWDQIQATPPFVAYPKNYDIKSVTAQVQELVAMAGAQVLPHMAKVQIAIPIVERMMTEAGADRAEVEIIVSAMKKFAQEEPMATATVPRQPPKELPEATEED